MPPAIRHCSFCGSDGIHTATRGTVVAVTCDMCRAEYLLEFQPADNPALTARIMTIREPQIDSDN